MDLQEYQKLQKKQSKIFSLWRKYMNMTVLNLKELIRSGNLTEAKTQNLTALVKLKTASKLNWTDEMYDTAEYNIREVKRLMENPTKNNEALKLHGHDHSIMKTGGDVGRVTTDLMSTDISRKKFVQEWLALFNMSDKELLQFYKWIKDHPEYKIDLRVSQYQIDLSIRGKQLNSKVLSGFANQDILVKLRNKPLKEWTMDDYYYAKDFALLYDFVSKKKDHVSQDNVIRRWKSLGIDFDKVTKQTKREPEVIKTQAFEFDNNYTVFHPDFEKWLESVKDGFELTESKNGRRIIHGYIDGRPIFQYNYKYNNFATNEYDIDALPEYFMKPKKEVNEVKQIETIIEPVNTMDKKDTVTLDIPLLIRILELAREDVKSDVELHEIVERLLELKNKETLTMEDYDYIAKLKEKYGEGGSITDQFEGEPTRPNVQKNLLSILHAELGEMIFWADQNGERTDDISKASELNIVYITDENGDALYVGKGIKIPKKKIMDVNSVMEVLNKDNVYENFSKTFGKILNKSGYSNSVTVYPTTYGIGVFVAFGYRDSVNSLKSKIESILDEAKIEYKTQYSDAGYVFRYIISKSKSNIEKISKFSDMQGETPMNENKESIPSSFSFEWFNDTMKDLEGGNITVDQYRKAFDYVVSEKDSIIELLSKKSKNDLLAMVGGMAQYRLKSENKPRVIEGVYDEMVDSFLIGTFSWSYGQDKTAVLREYVYSKTQTDLDEYAERVRAAVEERKASRAKLLKAIENPETLEEFKIFIQRKGIAELTPEQKRAYDAFVSETVLEKREQQIEQKAEIKKVEGVDTELKIIETVHTRDKYPLWVVQLGDRVEKEVYNELNAKAKQLGGYYSSFRGNGATPGFQFKSKESAEKFIGLKESDVSNIEQVEERLEEKAKNRAHRLRENAEKIIAKANESLNQQRLTNTYKRANQANIADDRANAEKRIGKTMINIADAIDSGDAKYLDHINSKTHIELLDLYVRRANSNFLSAKYKTYTEQQEHKYDPVTIECIDYLKEGIYPRIYKRNILDLVDKNMSRSGGILVAKRWESRIKSSDRNDEYYQIRTDEEIKELEKLFYNLFESERKYLMIKETIDNYNRMRSMKIENDSMFREVLREYIQYREGVQESDKVKKLERQLAGKGSSVGFDYFPTPMSVAQKMVDLANISPTHEVLEPSAGNGNIADMIKQNGVVPDVIEISSTLREILDAKGYPIIANDFETFDAKKYDRIIMNPPFSNSKDAEHIMHAFTLLKPGGIIVAIAGEGIFTRSDKKSQEFRDFLEANNAEVEKLDPKTFTDKTLYNTTGANARLIVLEKAVAEDTYTPTTETVEEVQAAPEENISDLIEGLKVLIEVSSEDEAKELKELIEGLELLKDNDTFALGGSINQQSNKGYSVTPITTPI